MRGEVVGAREKGLHSGMLHRFALVTAGATFLLIVLGALVTSNEAGDSVPDWPTAFGQWLPLEHIRGNVVYEYTHRVVAATVALLTLLLVWMLWRREERAWVRRLGLFAFLAVLGQAGLGGARVLLLEHRFAFALIHAFAAQFFFSLLVSLAVVTSPAWTRHERETSEEASAFLPAYFPKLSGLAVVGLFVQLLLGAGFRHRGLGILPHVVGAVGVSLLILWMARIVVRATRRREESRSPAAGPSESEIRWGTPSDFLRRVALGTIGLLVGQIALGIAAYLARRASRFDPQPLEPMISLTVAHVACGAVLLAFVLVLTWWAFRVSVGTPRTSVPAREVLRSERSPS